jgi:3-phosphoshikimate 1-carboxyvinyltransferase
MDQIVKASGPLRGEIQVPGDKSISHRAVLFGAISEGNTEASQFLMSADCLSTISCFEKMGIPISVDREHDTVTVHGKGLHGLKAPEEVLDSGNSGTTTRLLAGILAGQSFSSILDGDDSLRSRPMKRIIQPLTAMGASVQSLNQGSVPLRIEGGNLHGIHYESPVASAQVKSCVLLAGLYAEGETTVSEPALSRNHSELMLSGFGAEVSSRRGEKPGSFEASIKPGPRLRGQKVLVPGDISSAAYFIAAALITPGSEILIRQVGINPTRAGILKAVSAMGGDISILNQTSQGGECSADLLVRSSSLHGTTIEGELIPALIDELPVIAVLAAYAEGETIIRDAQELRVKESDRIAVTEKVLSAMGADIQGTEDGFLIHGGKALHGARVSSHQDHRIAMSLAVAAQNAEGEVIIEDGDAVRISYPDFFRDLEKLRR